MIMNMTERGVTREGVHQKVTGTPEIRARIAVSKMIILLLLILLFLIRVLPVDTPQRRIQMVHTMVKEKKSRKNRKQQASSFKSFSKKREKNEKSSCYQFSSWNFNSKAIW